MVELGVKISRAASTAWKMLDVGPRATAAGVVRVVAVWAAVEAGAAVVVVLVALDVSDDAGSVAALVVLGQPQPAEPVP